MQENVIVLPSQDLRLKPLHIKRDYQDKIIININRRFIWHSSLQKGRLKHSKKTIFYCKSDEEKDRYVEKDWAKGKMLE